LGDGQAETSSFPSGFGSYAGTTSCVRLTSAKIFTYFFGSEAGAITRCRQKCPPLRRRAALLFMALFYGFFVTPWLSTLVGCSPRPAHALFTH
jgi:hypothetical protein